MDCLRPVILPITCQYVRQGQAENEASLPPFQISHEIEPRNEMYPGPGNVAITQEPQTIPRQSAESMVKPPLDMDKQITQFILRASPGAEDL